MLLPYPRRLVVVDALSLLLSLSCAFSRSAPSPGRRTPIAELGFELVGGHIYVPVVVNGHKTTAIVDTGAASSVMDLGLAEQWNLPVRGQMTARGTGGEAVKGKILDGVSVKFDEVTVPVSYAVPLTPLASSEGRRLEVIVGHEFFAHYIVDIDYAQHRLRVFDPGTEVSFPGVVLPIRIVGNHPHLRLEMLAGSESYPLDAMIDTGASASGLTARFLSDHPLPLPMTPSGIIGGGVGGFIQGRFFRPRSLHVGSLAITNPVLTLTDTETGAGGQNSDREMDLGASILQRFHVTFDYGRERVILSSTANSFAPFEADKSGLLIVAGGNDFQDFRVVGVLAGSSSAQAGIQVDDVIESVDAVPASRLRLWGLRELFRAPVQQWQLEIRRGAQRLQVTVPARSII